MAMSRCNRSSGTTPVRVSPWWVLVSFALFIPGLSQSAPADRTADIPPPPPVVAPDNVSRVTAIVNKQSIWIPGSLKDAMPPVPDDQTLYAFRLKVLSVEPMDQKTLSAARTGIEIDVFSTVPLAKHWVGKKIAGVIKMVGDTRGVRWIFVDPAALKLAGKG